MPKKITLTLSTNKVMKFVKSQIVKSKNSIHNCKFCRDTGLLDLYFTEEYTTSLNEANSSTHTPCDCGIIPEIEIEGSGEYERMRSKLK